MPPLPSLVIEGRRYGEAVVALTSKVARARPFFLGNGIEKRGVTGMTEKRHGLLIKA